MKARGESGSGHRGCANVVSVPGIGPTWTAITWVRFDQRLFNTGSDLLSERDTPTSSLTQGNMDEDTGRAQHEI